MSVVMSLVRLASALALSAAALAAAGQPVDEAFKRPAPEAAKPQQAVLIGGAQAGQRLVAVGERGLVLVSDDHGAQWRQQPAPVSTTLTAVRFADERRGVAVGHAGIVLASTDGAQSWSVVLDGQRAAEIALQAAPGAASARRLVNDGPNKPFLDATFDGAGRLIVVGAYGLIFASSDLGRTWESWIGRLDNREELHLYAIRIRGAEIVIAGEQGRLFRSSDSGRTFRRIESPYRGSFFTVELPGTRDIVVAGLRGNIWRSSDGGTHWTQVRNDTQVSISASLQRADGAVLLGDQTGRLLRLEGDTLSAEKTAAVPLLNGLVSSGDGKRTFALTLHGVQPLQ